MEGNNSEGGKNRRSKQRCQDSCRKVHDHEQSFVLCSHNMQELCNQNGAIGYMEFLSQELTAIVFCARLRPKKATKTYKLHNHSY